MFESSRRSKVVVTGFGPFSGILDNSSSIAAENLQNKWLKLFSNQEEPFELIVKSNLKVTYTDAFCDTNMIWDKMKPVRE